MKRLDLKLICLMGLVVSLGACADLPKVTPHFLDTQLEEMREYQVVDKKRLEIKFKKAHPMEWGKNTYGNGFICIPPQEAAELKSWYLKMQSQENSGN